jgi:predicted Zn-dependent protease
MIFQRSTIALALIGAASLGNSCASATLVRGSAAQKKSQVRGYYYHGKQRKLQGDEDEEASGLVEDHSCTTDPQDAIDFVNQYGFPDQGDGDCLADPVGGCPDGCCRYGTYFVCDTENL